MKTKASDIARQAADLVSGDRARMHGDKEANLTNIARLWSAFLSPRGCDQLGPSEVALMMALLKIARTECGEHNLDDYIDAVGYVAIAGELAG